MPTAAKERTDWIKVGLLAAGTACIAAGLYIGDGKRPSGNSAASQSPTNPVDQHYNDPSYLIRKHDEAALLRTEQNGTYRSLQSEWAFAGGVPDVVAWQTPDGRAAIMVNREVVSARHDTKHPVGRALFFTVCTLLGASLGFRAMHSFREREAVEEINRGGGDGTE